VFSKKVQFPEQTLFVPFNEVGCQVGTMPEIGAKKIIRLSVQAGEKKKCCQVISHKDDLDL
jgi:hypothetical protein